MYKFLVMIFVLTSLSLVSSVKEWKNFENGKVYSRKMTNVETKAVETPDVPQVEERFLHSHHKDKNKKLNSEQSLDLKPLKSKNLERHHRKSVEEEMHLRPINERHHKFPNPALLDSSFGNTNSKISRHAMLQEVRRKQENKRRRIRGGKRSKRNKNEPALLVDNNSKSPQELKKGSKEIDQNQQQVKDAVNSKNLKNDYVQYKQTRKEVFPVKETSYW